MYSTMVCTSGAPNAALARGSDEVIPGSMMPYQVAKIMNVDIEDLMLAIRPAIFLVVTTLTHPPRPLRISLRKKNNSFLFFIQNHKICRLKNRLKNVRFAVAFTVFKTAKNVCVEIKKDNCYPFHHEIKIPTYQG